MTDPTALQHDILNKIDDVLADVTTCLCGCGQALNDRGPSPWFISDSHQERWYLRRAKSKSGIEEESVDAGAACSCPRDPDDDVDPGDPLSTCPVHGWSVSVLAASSSTSVGTSRILDETHRFTLADMEAASAAVRARRPADEYSIRPAGTPPIRPAEPVPDDVEVLTLRLEGYVGADVWAAANPSLGLPVTFAVDVSADGSGAVAVRDTDGHVHLTVVSHPVDAALEPSSDVDDIATSQDRPWWRRMLGGTR